MNFRIVYTRPEDGGVSVVSPAPKEHLELVLGPLTDEAYWAHIYERAIPKDAINVRKITVDEVPVSREFRDAWVDVTPTPNIDVSLEKVKDLVLKNIRRKRVKLLLEQDGLYQRAVELGLPTNDIVAEKNALRNATDPIKALDVAGKFNDDVLLKQLKDLDKLPEVDN